MKRTVKLKEATVVNAAFVDGLGGQIIGQLAEDDLTRGWAAGQELVTSTVIDVKGNLYETRNTIYEITDGQVLLKS